MRYLTRTTVSIICLAISLAACTGSENHTQTAWYTRSNSLYAYSGTDGNLWDSVRRDFQMPPNANHREVQRQIKWYQQHQEYLSYVITESSPYIYYIYQQTQKRGLPAELALIPIIESEYNPNAKSNKGAIGLWQMMPDTAKGFGLKKDTWYDGSKDVVASTNAALRYFNYLHRFFDDNWLLAVAAYDSGEGTVMRAMRYNQSNHYAADFWHLPLPAETRAYVPRLLALAAIVKNPGKYGIKIPPINNAPYVAQVNVGHPIDFNKAAKLAEVSPETIRALNPGYRHDKTGPKGPFSLLIPKEKADTFQLKLAMLSAKEKAIWQKHIVASRETLEKIAAQYHTTVAELRKINDLHTDKLYANQTIKIPSATSTLLALNEIKDPNQATAVTNNAGTVATNTNTDTDDATVTKTAATTESTAADKVTLAENTRTVKDEENLAQANTNNTDPVDTTTTTVAAASTSTAPATYTVAKGDTLRKIAKQHHITEEQLFAWNNLKHTGKLAIGKKLVVTNPNTTTQTTKLASNATAPTAKESNHIVYTVRSGDYIEKIARKYRVKTQDLIHWNQLSSEDDILQPGQKLIIQTSA